MRCKRTKQKRIKLLAMGKLKERLRNQPFDLRLALLDARIDELKRELKAAKVKWRAAWALRDERCEELDDFEQALSSTTARTMLLASRCCPRQRSRRSATTRATGLA